MTGRAIAEAGVAILLGLVLSILGAGTLELIEGSDAGVAFLDAGPRLIFGALWPALVLWALLVIIGNLSNRRRAAGWKLLTNLVSTFVVAVLSAVGWLYISIAAGGFGMLMFGIALVASGIFFVAATVGFLVTHLVLFRRRADGR